jgi:hypothetical protein
MVFILEFCDIFIKGLHVKFKLLSQERVQLRKVQ